MEKLKPEEWRLSKQHINEHGFGITINFHIQTLLATQCMVHLAYQHYYKSVAHQWLGIINCWIKTNLENYGLVSFFTHLLLFFFFFYFFFWMPTWQARWFVTQNHLGRLCGNCQEKSRHFKKKQNLAGDWTNHLSITIYYRLTSTSQMNRRRALPAEPVGKSNSWWSQLGDEWKHLFPLSQ